MKNNPLRSPPLVPPASRDQVEKFLKGLQRFRSRGFSPLKGIRPEDEIEVKNYDQAAVKKYLDEKMTAGMQQSIAQRIIMDILKSPIPDARDQRKRAAKKKKDPKAKPARGSKSKRPPSKARKARKRK